jgi:serine protease inhibitor
VLLNAVYFKGLFQTKFLKNETKEDLSFNGGNNEKKTEMMRRTRKFNYTEVKQIDSKVLEIPYSADDISLYIVLPNERQGPMKLSSGINFWEQIK